MNQPKEQTEEAVETWYIASGLRWNGHTFCEYVRSSKASSISAKCQTDNSPCNPVATVCGVSDNEVYSRARLIAAAPELLEAAQNIIRFDDSVSIGRPIFSLEKLRAAIAKATSVTEIGSE